MVVVVVIALLRWPEKVRLPIGAAQRLVYTDTEVKTRTKEIIGRANQKQQEQQTSQNAKRNRKPVGCWSTMKTSYCCSAVGRIEPTENESCVEMSGVCLNPTSTADDDCCWRREFHHHHHHHHWRRLRRRLFWTYKSKSNI